MLLPVNSAIPEAVHKLVIDQFGQVWQAARQSQGVTSGTDPVAGRSHPDVEQRFQGLPTETQRWITGLVFGRVLVFKVLPKDELSSLIEAGINRSVVNAGLREKLARQFHDTWWSWRRMNGQSGHEGDKPWEDETEVQRENDLVLVDNWAILLGLVKK